MEQQPTIPWIRTQIRVEVIEFDEPHPCGGVSRVRVTKEDALSSQRELLKARGVDLGIITDDEILLHFITCNQARLKKVWAIIDEQGRIIL